MRPAGNVAYSKGALMSSRIKQLRQVRRPARSRAQLLSTRLEEMDLIHFQNLKLLTTVRHQAYLRYKRLFA